MKRCTKCVTPETHETIHFDNDGVCSICKQLEVKNERINWENQKVEFEKIIEQYRGKFDYDCIVPFSGGKDSTWTLYYLVKKYGLKPLVVQFNHGFLRQNLLDNNIRTIRKLGVDFHSFTPNWKVVRKLMLQMFLEKGDFCWHCHTGIFAYPMRVALNYKVPLVIWGEPSAEYTSYYSYDQPEEVDEKRFNRITNLGVSSNDMFIRFEGSIDERDLLPFSYPELRELRKLNYRSICLGSYIPWNTQRQSEIISRELGWNGDVVEGVPAEFNYEKIECYLQGVRDYIKYIKRGYTRPTHLMSIDIRHGRRTREEALEVIKQYENRRPANLDIFLKFVGLTEEEFNEIALGHGVSPYEHDFSKTTKGERLHDFDLCSQEGAMPREEALEILARYKKRNGQ